jgi:hypothetical protein
MQPLGFSEKLRIQFSKAIRKGHTKDALLDPVPSAAILNVLQADEVVVVKVQARTGKQYWFTSARLFEDDGTANRQLMRYSDVARAHWIFRDLSKRIISAGSGQNWAAIKVANFDRIEIEAGDSVTVLEGLDQAYWPTLHFFQWIQSGAGDSGQKAINPGSARAEPSQ